MHEDTQGLGQCDVLSFSLSPRVLLAKPRSARAALGDDRRSGGWNWAPHENWVASPGLAAARSRALGPEGAVPGRVVR